MSSFLWGASTSAQQVEGNLHHTDWSGWRKAGNPQAIRRASGHYDQFAADLTLAKQLGHNAHRLSLDWSRIEPVPGEFSSEALKHYREVLTILRDLGLISIVTLHHFANPVWLAQRGGWLHPEALSAFSKYAEVVVKSLGDIVGMWITLHDPVYLAQMMTSTQSEWPTQITGWRAQTKLLRQFAAAHRAAYKIIHRYDPQALVGVSVRYDANPKLQRAWLETTKNMHDFIGVQLGSDSPTVLSIMQQLPLRRDHIYVTEDGIATDNDQLRATYLRQRLRQIEAAQAMGIPIRGYIHRSLLDGFEWLDGFQSRYGLVEVDFNTLTRTPRHSAYVYQAIINQSQS